MTASISVRPLLPLVRAALFAGSGIALALVLVSRLMVPDVSLLSLLGGCLLALIYAVLSYFGPARLELGHPLVLRISLIAGLAAGAVLGGEILLEYILLPADNTSFGLIEYGGAFLIWLAAGLFVGYKTYRIRYAILAAVSAAMIGLLIWLIVLLATFYVFRGTAIQDKVWAAEGTYQDWARSGMADFNTFVMEDLLGATFFHLLLGPFIASITGAIGGLIGKVIGKRYES